MDTQPLTTQRPAATGTPPPDLAQPSSKLTPWQSRVRSLLHNGAHLPDKVRQLTVRAVSRVRDVDGDAIALTRGISKIRRTLGIPRVQRQVRQQRTMTVMRSIDELQQLWTALETVPHVWGHMATITRHGDRLRWSVNTPLGPNLEWETESVEPAAGEFMRWRSAPESVVKSEGAIAFRPAAGQRGTEVSLQLAVELDGPATAAAELVDQLEDLFAAKALRRFKSLAEAGEAPTLQHNPAARPQAPAMVA